MEDEIIVRLIKQVILHEGNTFDNLCAAMHQYTSESGNTLQEIKKKQSTKAKGDLFEAFCKKYLKLFYEDVWLLKEVPQDVKLASQLHNNDMGIDLVVRRDANSNCSAVQCKWKSPFAKGRVPGTRKLRREMVNWGELCTFLVLCERTGPWDKYIVMTNGVGVRRVGRRSPKDLSMCLKTFQNISVEQWYKMADMEGCKLSSSSSNEKESGLSIQEKRLLYFEN